jgi:23S rRNA (adenine-N6)-dimethyltransferase
VLLQIEKRERPLVKEKHKQLYRDFIVYGFNQWKLNLKGALKKIFTYEQLKRLSKDLGFNLSATATELNFNQWLGLFNYFMVGVEDNKKALVYETERILSQQQRRLQKIHRTRFND